MGSIVMQERQEAQAFTRAGFDLLYVDMIAEKLARCATGNPDLVFAFDLTPPQRAYLRKLARTAIEAAKDGLQ